MNSINDPKEVLNRTIKNFPNLTKEINNYINIMGRDVPAHIFIGNPKD